jgi:hypothetical protein
MSGALFIQSLALLLAWTEGNKYSINVMLAILFCLRNQVAAKLENGDLGKIIEKCIGFYGIGTIPDTRNPDFQQVMGYVEGIFDNSIQDRLTNGALYWGIEKPVGAKERVAQVGQMLFWS